MSRVRLPFDELVSLLTRVFRQHGTSDTVAAVLAHNCASAQRDGSESHGVFRIPGYLSTLASGWVDGGAEPVVEDCAPGFVAVDAGNGFAQPALEAGRELLLDKVRHNGIALMAIRNSHHFAALWPDVEPFAREGLVAIALVNSMACVVPAGGRKPLFGTNPISFAAPRSGHHLLVFDLATSAIAHGDVQIAAKEGSTLPEGCGVDAQGQPTCDPEKILDGGALLPFGGYKGSALSMMVELMAAALTGGNFSFQFDWSGHPGAKTPWTGELIIVIDPAPGAGSNFADRTEALVKAMVDAGQQRQPGDRRYRQRAEAEQAGVPVDSDDLSYLRSLVT